MVYTEEHLFQDCASSGKRGKPNLDVYSQTWEAFTTWIESQLVIGKVCISASQQRRLPAFYLRTCVLTLSSLVFLCEGSKHASIRKVCLESGEFQARLQGPSPCVHTGGILRKVRRGQRGLLPSFNECLSIGLSI